MLQQQQISLVPQPSVDAVQQQHHQQHPQQKPFVCEICGKGFRFRSNLAEHRSVHTAMKPFVCKFCGKSSRLKGNLTKHILKHHKIEQKEYIGTDEYIIKKGKKSVKDPAAIEFLEKSMIILNNAVGGGNNQQNVQHHFINAAPGSAQSADSGGTDQQNGAAAEFDGQGILLSLGLDSGSLDLKAEEAMDEEDDNNFVVLNQNHCQQSPSGLLENNDKQHLHQEATKLYPLDGSTANERLLEHCESAIYSGGDAAEPTQRHNNGDEDGINESDDADGTGADDFSGAECQSSGNQSPILPLDSTAGTNALAAAACKALLFGQMDNKMLAKALLSAGARSASACGASAGQKDASSAAAVSELNTNQQQQQQQQQATNDEIMRILQQMSSMTAEQQQQQQQQAVPSVVVVAAAGDDHQLQPITAGGLTAATATASSSSTNKLATQCQLCGKHFRKPRDLIAHLSSNAHKFCSSTPPASTANCWSTTTTTATTMDTNNSSNSGIINPLLLLSNNGTALTEEASAAQNVQQPQQQDAIGRFFKALSPTAAAVMPSQFLTTATTAAAASDTSAAATADGDVLRHNLAVANELRQLRNTVAELRTSTGGSNKLEQMLSQLDSRVCRLEKQLDMALNSIYTLVQLQTGINNSVQKLASSITPNANHRTSLKTEQ